MAVVGPEYSVFQAFGPAFVNPMGSALLISGPTVLFALPMMNQRSFGVGLPLASSEGEHCRPA